MDSTYIPVGIISKVAEDHKISNDEAEVVLREEAKSLTELYDKGNALAFFDDVHRAALHIIGQNNLLPVSVYREILRDLEICDSVLMQIKGILVRIYKADKRTSFILALQQFYDNLSEDYLRLTLIDTFKTLEKYSETPPDPPNDNDKKLIGILNDAASSIPDYVNPEKRKLFELDRIRIVSKILDKFEQNSQTKKENPWA